MLATAKIPVIMFEQKNAYNEKICNSEFGSAAYGHYLLEAAEAIRKSDCEAARNLLKQYMSKDMENPEAYNLLGISYEIEGDRLKAARFYRVAYYMDQTFSAPSENLGRIGMLWCKEKQDISWGLERVKGNS